VLLGMNHYLRRRGGVITDRIGVRTAHHRDILGSQPVRLTPELPGITRASPRTMNTAVSGARSSTRATTAGSSPLAAGTPPSPRPVQQARSA
jgi:hypothetical protein